MVRRLMLDFVWRERQAIALALLIFMVGSMPAYNARASTIVNLATQPEAAIRCSS